MSDRKPYFKAATDWAVDTRSRDTRSQRTAWIIAGVSVGVALLEAVALAMLTPLKTVAPVTILVDRQTGFVQALDPLRPRQIGADAALTQSLLAQYVTAREGFDRATISHDYQRVALWSGGGARSQYLALMPATNPASPLQKFANGTVVAAQVKSVSKLGEGVALVRFDTQLQDATGRETIARPWIAIVRYHFTDAPMTFEQRLVNPLGFQVTSYRRDPEAPPASDPAEQRNVPDPVTAPAWRPTSLAPRANGSELGRVFMARGVDLSHIPLGSPLLPLTSRPERVRLGSNQ